MKRGGFLAVLLVWGAVGAVLLPIKDHAASAQSPDSWRQLSLADFVREITQLTSGSEPLADELWAEIRSQAAERLLQAVAAGTPADYGDLVSLYLWGRPHLSPEQVAAVLAGLRPPANQLAEWTFEQLRAVQDRMSQANMPADSLHAVTLAWLEQRDVRTLENVDQLGWLFAQVQIIDRQEIGPQEFSVRWTGLVRAPADGTYTFSLCPLDLNYEHAGTFRQQTTKIWLAERQILDSTQNGWTFQSSGVPLSATAPTPIRVELSYACSSQGVIYDRPAIALLYWEAPGLRKQLVPASAFITPEGTQSGLQGEYQLRNNGQEVSATRVDPQLNFLWYHQLFILSPHAELRTQLAEQLYAVASSENTLASWESPDYTNPEPWQAHWAFLESLAVTRHQPWAQLLAAHPVLLEDCARGAAVNLYSRCRVGAPDEALQTFGLWAQSHADELPTLSVDFYRANREDYHLLARKIVSQYRPHLEALEQGYLQLPDGRCALPVAYTLCYGYWLEGRIGEWIDQLEARFSDEQLSGDRRVNWLLARAQAEEIRQSPPHPHWYTVERSLAGRGWLEEATLVAASEPVRLRAFQELAARLTVDERLAAATKMLDQAAQRCASAASTTALAQWRGRLDALGQALQARRAAQETGAKNAYVQQLRARHARAVEHGDEAATSRYEQLLSAAGAGDP